MVTSYILGFGGHGSVTSSLSSKAFETTAPVTLANSSAAYSSGSSSSKGLAFKEVLATLVLLTRGTHEEKIKCKHTTIRDIMSGSSIHV